MAEGSFVHRVADLELQPAPLDPDTILEGAPELLDASPEGRVTRGVWQITPGVVADVEADEFFVVGVLHAGDRAVWRIPRDPPGSLPDHRAGVVHTGSADMSGPPSSLYKRWFKLPRKCTCKGASLVIDVHADNDVTISLNGVVFGAQPAGDLFANFQDPPERFTTTGPFRRWKNVLGFSVRDCGNPTGLDYSATVTCKRKHHHWGWGH
jgi:hypothetical protein